MKLVHSQTSIPEKVKKPTKREQYNEEMKQALRRRQFVDFQTALKDPEVKSMIASVQKVIPGWIPKFRK